MTVFRASEDFKILIGANIIGGVDVTDEGGRVISYTQGAVFDATNDIVQNIVAAASADLATDDTHYLYWNNGTSLTTATSAPTGNQVLVATIITAGGDITSVTNAGFDPTQVTGISVRPTIRLSGDHELDYHQAGGKIIINEENLVRVDDKVQFRDELYRVLIDLFFDGTGSGTIKGILAEIDVKIRANNATAREYYYRLGYSWKSVYREGLVTVVLDAIREMVSV